MSADALRRVCLIGGNGTFGRVLARKFKAAGLEVAGVDLPAADGEAHPRDLFDDWQDGEIGELLDLRRDWFARCDLLMFCTPENVAIAHLPVALAIDGISSFSDICSVKTRIARVVAEAARHREFSYLSIHPMFAPVADFAGLNFCLVPMAGANPARARFEKIITSWNVRCTSLTAEEHDRLTAWVQAACHFAILGYGAALAASGASWESMQRISTPTQQLLLSLVARIALSDEATYGQIQKENPFAAEARAEIAAASSRLEQLSGGAPEQTFQNLFRHIAGYLANEGGQLKDLSDRLIELVRQTR